MTFEHNSKNKQILAVVVGLLVLAGVFFYIAWYKPVTPQQIACTQEAKLCPDGTAVGRTGPNCEFAPCPTGEINEGWLTATDSQAGVSFQYPEQLTTTYIHTVDWPPKVQVLNQAFSCTEGGSEINRAGQTAKRMVDSRNYCRTIESEGAAGSIYNMYAYAFPSGSRTVIFTFTLRLVQCPNYDDPQKTACENEREAFDMDSVVDRMAQTVKLTK